MSVWAAGNLAKVDHIVVVMMENRSFDHVMGYLGLLAGAQGEEGWSNDLITFLANSGFTVPKLSDSTITPNAAGLKTRFPYSVGHALADVAQQLSARLQLPTGGQINSPQGFIDDFQKEVGSDNFDLNNVLGYYDATTLSSTATWPKTMVIVNGITPLIPVRRCPTGCIPFPATFNTTGWAKRSWTTTIPTTSRCRGR